MDYDRPLPAYLLVSEMAWGDLSSIAARVPLTSAQWFGIVRGILTAIGALQEDLAVVHNDLHFGNVLVALVDTADADGCRTLLPLVHDFGRSYEVEVWMPDDRVRDVEKVIEGLLSLTRLPPAVRAAALELDREVASIHTRDYVIDDIIALWDDLAASGGASLRQDF